MRGPMLGAIKGDPETEGVPLFRLLARRWKSLAPVKRERITYLATPVDNDQPKPTRAWISKARRPVHSQQTFEPTISKRAWNPWLWMR